VLARPLPERKLMRDPEAEGAVVARRVRDPRVEEGGSEGGCASTRRLYGTAPPSASFAIDPYSFLLEPFIERKTKLLGNSEETKTG
jgi:hypothetical protein